MNNVIDSYMEVPVKDEVYLDKLKDVGREFLGLSLLVQVICIMWIYRMWKEFKSDGYKNNKYR